MGELDQVVRALGLAKYIRHIFLSADQTEAKCCDRESGFATRDFL